MLEKGNVYEMRKAVDAGNKSEYIEMWGNLSNGDIFLIRSPLESIRESVMISNRFPGVHWHCRDTDKRSDCIVFLKENYRSDSNWRRCHREWRIWILTQNIRAAGKMRLVF